MDIEIIIRNILMVTFIILGWVALILVVYLILIARQLLKSFKNLSMRVESAANDIGAVRDGVMQLGIRALSILLGRRK